MSCSEITFAQLLVSIMSSVSKSGTMPSPPAANMALLAAINSAPDSSCSSALSVAAATVVPVSPLALETLELETYPMGFFAAASADNNRRNTDRAEPAFGTCVDPTVRVHDAADRIDCLAKNMYVLYDVYSPRFL